MIKVVIADDQILIREGIKYIVEQDKDICVIGMAGNGFEVLDMCKTHKPDLILMDIMMPGCNGVMATKLIKEKYESIKIIVLTTFHDKVNVQKSLKYGADGFILKEVKPEDLIMAIKCTLNGLRIVHQSVFNSAMKLILNDSEEAAKEDETNNVWKVLNEREIEIIRMVVFGKTNKDIASHISLSEGRVKNIITDILKKLGLSDRTQLAIYAVKNKLA